MTRLWFVCTIVLTLSRGVAAQAQEVGTVDAQLPIVGTYRTYEDIIVTAPAPIETSRSGKGVGFWAMGGALTTAMLLDTKSTFDVIGRCTRCYEANPFAAPFVNRGPTVAISAGLAFDAGVMALAAKMKQSEHARFRRIWWVLPAALTAGHLIAYKHNQSVAR